MRKWKRGLAVALTATMVMGNGLTVFAGDDAGSGGDTTPTTTSPNEGTAQGAGTSEGHVDKKKLNVVLPTTTNETFAYTMDPERLIQGTSGKKYPEGTVFPEKDSDTGVYFLTGEKKYENKSNDIQVINKSSCNVTITVKASAEQNTANDITLAENSNFTGDDPLLWLNLKVGKTDKSITTNEVSVTKTIEGKAENFETVVKDGNYAYQEKTTLADWNALNISMNGSVYEKPIESDTTAPTVNVTWSWAEAAADATADTADQTPTKGDASPVFSCNDIGVITYTAGAGDLAFKALKSLSAPWEGAPLDITSFASVDASNLKITVDSAVLGGWAANGENPTANITYENQAGQENTATVILKTH